MSSISISQLDVSYGSGIRVIDGLDLHIPDGSFFTLLGPSGCGKTTLLRVIAGFIRPSGGRLAFGDVDMTQVPAHRRGIGMVFQDYALFPDKTVFDNVAYGLRARRTDAATLRRKVGEYLERVGMSGFAERHPAALSGGQRQRVALARALAIEPEVLLMDEPLSNLDAQLRLQIRAAIADLQREIGITTVFVTHDQEEALTLSDRIAVFSEGQVQQVGTPQEIYERPRNRFVADFIGETNFLDAQVLGLEGDQALCQGPGGQPFRAETVAGVLPGSRVSLSIRPERVHLGAVDTAGALPCRVEAQVYLGTDLQYQVSLDDGTRLTVRMPNSQVRHRRFGVGERAALQFENGSASVLLD